MDLHILRRLQHALAFVSLSRLARPHLHTSVCLRIVNHVYIFGGREENRVHCEPCSVEKPLGELTFGLITPNPNVYKANTLISYREMPPNVLYTSASTTNPALYSGLSAACFLTPASTVYMAFS